MAVAKTGLRMSHITRRGLGLLSAVLLVLLANAGSALAQASSEEAQGTQLLQAVQNGQKSCGDLANSDFELIGEAWMGQMFGSSQSHEAMNRVMSSMMGPSGERQMHEYLGRRASGCGGGSLPPGFGQMMSGVRGITGMMGGPALGMMGGRGFPAGGYGSMMGAPQSNQDDDNDVSGWAVGGMILFMLLLIAGAYLVVRALRSRQTVDGPVETLKRRLAAGEITQDDYEKRLSLLGGGK